VLCEKPAALTLEDAFAMRDAAAAAGLELRIGFMRRFDPALDALLEAGARSGRPLLAQATITAGIRPKRLMHDAHANGGPIIDMCCHLFYVWGLLFDGQPVDVAARGYTFSDGKPEVAHIAHRALDSALITLAYPGGTVGQIQVSWGLPSGVAPVERHTYVGPEGLVAVDWPERVVRYDGHGEHAWTQSGSDPWRAEIAAFHAELTTDAPRRVPGIEDGIDALRTSLAVLRSVAEGRPIALADVARDDPPAPVTSSVLPPPTSITMTGRSSSTASAAPAKASDASVPPGRMWTSAPARSRRRSTTSDRFGASRTALVHTAMVRSGAKARARSAKGVSAASRRASASSRSVPSAAASRRRPMTVDHRFPAGPPSATPSQQKRRSEFEPTSSTARRPGVT
jgi:hypothetical protein